jgi:molecular chaperone GrpE (heat shock protein)
MSDEVWKEMPDLPERSDDAAPTATDAVDEAAPVAEVDPPPGVDDGVPPAPAETAHANGDSPKVADAEPEHAEDGTEAAAAEGEAPAFDAIVERLDAVAGSVAELAALEQRHTDLIERLHADNTRLRGGEIVTALKPLFLDLARLYDDVDDMIERGGEEFARVGIVRDLVADLLARHGVERLDPDAGTPFESGRHTAVGVVPTEDAALDGSVASVRRIGFLRDGVHVVRPAQVYVHRSAPAPSAAAGSDTQNDSETEMGQQ